MPGTGSSCLLFPGALVVADNEALAHRARGAPRTHGTIPRARNEATQRRSQVHTGYALTKRAIERGGVSIHRALQSCCLPVPRPHAVAEGLFKRGRALRVQERAVAGHGAALQ